MAEVAAAHISRCATESIADKGAFHCVLAGGSSPKLTYQALLKLDNDWAFWHIYIGDERCLPATHVERNSLMIEKTLIYPAGIKLEHYHPIPADLPPEEAADDYALVLPASPDFVLLGMGEDGHTASLFPGHIHEEDQDVVAVHQSPKPPSERVSLSYEYLSSAKNTLILASGEGKQAAMLAWHQGRELPVANIAAAAKAQVFADYTALGELRGQLS